MFFAQRDAPIFRLNNNPIDALLFGIFFILCMKCSGSTFHYTITANHRDNRAKKAFHIHPKAHVLDIITIHFRLYINLQFVSTVDLCTSRQAGTNVICTIFIPLFDQVKLSELCKKVTLNVS